MQAARAPGKLTSLEAPSPLLLSTWLAACERAGVAAIEASFSPPIRIDEIHGALRERGPGASLRAASAWLQLTLVPGSIWRWDCCASAGLKEALASGALRQAPELLFELDDERLLLVLGMLEDDDIDRVRLAVRPWITPRIEADRPVEFRVFVDGSSVAASNYHASRPLPASYEPLARRSIALARSLAPHAPLRRFSADFLLADDDRLLFLEGGLGFDNGRLVDACCFDHVPADDEVVLEASPPNPLSGKRSGGA